MDKPHISFKPQEIFKIFDFSVTNSILTSLIVLISFLFLALYYQNQGKKPARNRSNLYYLINFFVKMLYEFFKTILGQEKISSYYPILAAFFLFIILQNWFGLLPGVGSLMLKLKENHGYHYVPIFRGATTDLNTTLGLALLSVGLTNYYSIKILGFKRFVNRFYSLKNPTSFFVGTLEIISEFSKIISFSFRLFGNIFAGEVLLTVIAFLIPILASFPFLLLEIFVGFIQALVFSALTAVFISSAVTEHH